jgi:hypothetical protein
VYHENKRGSGSIVPHFFIFSTRWRWMIIFTLWLLTAGKVVPITSLRHFGKEKSLLPLYAKKRNLMMESYGHLHALCALSSPCTVCTTISIHCVHYTLIFTSFYFYFATYALPCLSFFFSPSTVYYSSVC